MYYIEFDVSPGRKGFWCGSGTIWRPKADKHCWHRRSKEVAEATAKRLGKNASVVFVEE